MAPRLRRIAENLGEGADGLLFMPPVTIGPRPWRDIGPRLDSWLRDVIAALLDDSGRRDLKSRRGRVFDGKQDIRLIRLPTIAETEIDRRRLAFGKNLVELRLVLAAE